MKTLFKLAATVSLLVSAAHAGITVSSPANGTDVGTPVHIVANASSSSPIVAMQVYVDNNLAYSVGSNSIDTYLSMATGWRYVVVQSWDANGGVQKSPLNVNVAYSTTVQPSASSGISVSSPANGSTVSSPAHFVASASGAVAMKVYVDDQIAYSIGAGSMDTYISMASGTRNVVVQTWDSNGNVQKQPLTVNVSGSGGSSTPTTSSNAYYDIDQMSGWESCDSCAGIGGVGATIPYSYTQGRGDPSIDGSSMEFWIGGDVPYSNALWWKQLTPQPGATNFTYDLYFYIKNPNAAQALEFDVNQSVNGRKYIWGTECNMDETHTWRIWDTANGNWVDSGVPCAQPSAYTWHHLVWEFQRNGDAVVFVAVTLDGQKSYVNRQFWSKSIGTVSELNAAFQLDGNYNQTDYSVWLDKVKLYYW